ncbi:vesicle-associated membrane protein 4 isoform X1 [Arvicola amphibius]|uniref:vesicle-associated membrane protein 4 isoform X1 n=1 Tax=Arvicola amphibius TaxID=1047088 RepID=UPI0018E35BDB|nr:vesicle-associated membrane protein 4 isoform X1 [Arvicola amphibius]
MPPKFKRHLNDDDVTGSVKSERRNLLEDDSDEEEDFFLRGPSGPRFGPRNDKIKHVQNQVDEVIDVMQENITKVIERGERLDELQDKSESLSDNATAFSNRSKQLRRHMWWHGCKVSKGEGGVGSRERFEEKGPLVSELSENQRCNCSSYWAISSVLDTKE